jgi:hypothetical protein
LRHRSRTSTRVLAALGIASSIASYRSDARADLDFQLTAGVGLAWRRKMPELESSSASTAARDIAPTKVAIGGSVLSLGGGVDMSAIVDDHWTIPMLGIAGYGAVGSYDTIVTSLDGSIARVRPWTTYNVDILLPGLGYRMKKRRFMFSATVRTGIVALSTNGSVAGGAGEVPIDLTGYSPLLQVELEACRRLDPVRRACVQLAPRIYDFGFINGATLGLRLEWGP